MTRTFPTPAQDTENRMKTKEYIRPMPATWFLHNRHLVVYAIRELTSFFVTGYAIFLILVLARTNHSKSDFRAFYESVLRSRASLIVHLIVLAFVVFHSTTSFNGMARVLVVRRGEERVSPTLIAILNYGAWLVVSVLIFVGVIVFK